MPVGSSSHSPVEGLQLVADPHRWQLLSLLGASDRRVGELASLVGRAPNLVSYHLGELRSAGLVSSRRSSADGRDTYYRLELERFGDLMGAAASALHPALALRPVSPPEPMAPSGRPPKVLFLCTGNSARSQMAEALLTARTEGAVEARSAGSHPKALHPMAVRVLAERGIDIAGNRTKHLDRFTRTRFDRVITLCDKVREVCPEFAGAPVTAHWSIADPAAVAGADDEVHHTFEATAQDIDARVGLLIAELARHTEERSTHAHH